MVNKSTYTNWLNNASQQLADADIPTARLDAELILAHALGVDRTWVIAHGDETFPTTPAETTVSTALAVVTSRDFFEDSAFPAERGKISNQLAPSESEKKLRESDDGLQKQVNRLITLRSQRIPLAYLIGDKEFYGRSFAVTADVLIPRPESEVMIDLLKELTHTTPTRLLDVGTGSGCLAITSKLECPQLSVTACDISPAALAIAQKNAIQLGADITFIQSNLLDVFRTPTKTRFDLIIANLPYVDRDWQRSPETDHEPAQALFADDGGLALIMQLLQQTPSCLTPNGRLLLEADPEQHDTIAAQAHQYGLHEIDRRDYCIVLELQRL